MAPDARCCEGSGTCDGGVLGLDVGGVLGVHLPGLLLLLGDLVLDVDVVAARPVQLQARALQVLHLALEQLHGRKQVTKEPLGNALQLSCFTNDDKHHYCTKYWQIPFSF